MSTLVDVDLPRYDGAEVVARRLDPASAASAVLARGAVDPGAAARPDVA